MAEIPDHLLSDLYQHYRDPSGKTFIYFGNYHAPDGQVYPVAVKRITSSGMREPYNSLEECRNQLCLRSENVCQIYGWNMTAQHVSIVMERMDNDLAREIAMRKEQNYWYTEVELLKLLWDVGGVFAELQLRNIAHSDIKAENIFVLKRMQSIVYKVGDFGSAGTVYSHVNHIKGTPLYLSPILKREHRLFRPGQQGRSFILHDPIKSDVFSLGVTMLYAAELQAPNDLMDDSNLEWKLNYHLMRVASTYPTLERILRSMLTVDESKRCDFKTIKQNLLQLEQLRGIACIDQLSASIHSYYPKSPQQDSLESLNQAIEAQNWESVSFLLEVLENTEDIRMLRPKGVRVGRMCRHCTGFRWRDGVCEDCRLPAPRV